MAVTYVKDLYNGTLVTYGMLNQIENAGVFTGIVHGLNDNIASLGSAVAAAVAFHGYTHPLNGAPLRRVTPFMYAPDKAKVRMEYGWMINYWAQLYGPATPQIDEGLTSELHFRYNGTVTGTAGGTVATPASDWSSFYRSVDQTILTVPITATASPFNVTAPIVGSVNSDTITYGGRTFTPTQMRYTGMVQRIRNQTGLIVVGQTALAFDILYRYVIQLHGFFEYFIPAAGTVEGSAAAYPATPFSGAFPTS